MARIRLFTIFIFLSLMAQSVMGQSYYALLIGIGSYPENSGWNVIHGNNDVAILQTMLMRQGFAERNIKVLLDSAATKVNILKAFDELSSEVQFGDVLYIHFSGHGQQITDLNGDEEDGFDEAWIPYDARKQFESGVYEGENHLVDDELNTILMRLRIRVGTRGKIIVVADACHSGGGSRGYMEEEVFVRGTQDKFIIPRQPTNIQKKPELIEWLFVAACKPYQTNYEYRSPNGKYYGVLSYVIANDAQQFDACRYWNLLETWSRNVSEKTRFPQDLDNEGQPSREDSFMF